MNTDAIFLQLSTGALVRAPLGEYVSEDVLQRLVADYPELLGGDQINPDDPPRWLLVTREAGVPDAADAASRWSVDHLLVDHRAVPTFIEVKRSSDTRIRREIVGQMLEYAANAITYWPVDRIRSLAAMRAGGPDALERQVTDLVGSASQDPTTAVEAFWANVEENLRAGRVRLLFVADELPRELRRIIEFLNEQMPAIEVLGVELRRYDGGDVRALVPRVIGQSERVRASRTQESRGRTNAEAFLGLLEPTARGFFQRILDEARARSLSVSWGTKGFSLRVMRPTGELVSLLYGYPPGAVGRELPILEIYLKGLLPADDPDGLRKSLLALPGFRERGQFTVGCEITPDTIPGVAPSLVTLWEAYERVRNHSA